MTQRDTIQVALSELNQRAWGVAIGLVVGGGLFFATLILRLRTGADAGAHLSLLAAYLPGYSVTIVGSVIGFIYGFLLGYGAGRLLATIYNRLV